MNMPRRQQWTTAGRVESGRVIYVATRAEHSARVAFGQITDGYLAVDGLVVKRQGLIDDSLERAIETARLLLESKNHASQSKARRRRR